MITPEIRYKKTAKGMMITEYSGTDSYVVLPDEIEGEAVTALDDYAFTHSTAAGILRNWLWEISCWTWEAVR